MKKCILFLLLALLLPASLCAAAEVPEEDVAIGGIRIGSTISYVESIYGEPNRIERPGGWNSFPDNPKVYGIHYSYGSSVVMRFRADNETLYAMEVTEDNGFQTPRGIHVGSTRADIIRAYNEGESTTKMYTYAYGRVKERLSIRLDDSDRVRSISLTIPAMYAS